MMKMIIASVAIVAMLALFVGLKLIAGHSPSYISDRATVASTPHEFPSNRPPHTHREPKNYELIAENNLFRPLGWKKEVPEIVRRAPRRVEPQPINVEAPAAAPTYILALTGLVQNGSEWLAVVEDRRRNEGVFVRQGERLKDTIVSEILPEQIYLVRDDEKIELTLGESIEYGADGHVLFRTIKTTKALSADRMQPRPTLSETPTSAPQETQGDGMDNQQSLLERMRARRRRELGQ